MKLLISGKIGENALEAFSNAIIIQAVNDYRAAKRTLRTHPNHYTSKKTIKEIRDFFYGDWYPMLSTVNPHAIIDRLDAEFKRKRKYEKKTD